MFDWVLNTPLNRYAGDKLFVKAKETYLTIYALTPQNGQTHSNNSSAISDELSECS